MSTICWLIRWRISGALNTRRSPDTWTARHMCACPSCAAFARVSAELATRLSQDAFRCPRRPAAAPPSSFAARSRGMAAAAALLLALGVAALWRAQPAHTSAARHAAKPPSRDALEALAPLREWATGAAGLAAGEPVDAEFDRLADDASAAIRSLAATLAMD